MNRQIRVSIRRQKVLRRVGVVSLGDLIDCLLNEFAFLNPSHTLLVLISLRFLGPFNLLSAHWTWYIGGYSPLCALSCLHYALLYFKGV